MQNPSTDLTRTSTSYPIRIVSSKLGRGDDTTASTCEIPNLENLMGFKNNDYEHSGMEGVTGSPFLREKLMGDAIRTGDALRRVKTVAQKK